MIKIKQLLPTLTSLGALILECLPWGVVLHFADPEGVDRVKETPFFSLLPYGYGVVGPFFAFLLTFLLVVLTVIGTWKSGKKLCRTVFIIGIIAALLALSPVLFGWRYLTLVSFLVALLLALAAIFSVKRG